MVVCKINDEGIAGERLITILLIITLQLQVHLELSSCSYFADHLDKNTSLTLRSHYIAFF